MAIAGCVVRVWCCALFLGVVLLVWPLGDRHAVAQGISTDTHTHVLFRVCLKRLSLSCVSNETHSNSNSNRAHFYEKIRAAGPRRAVIRVQVSAAEPSTVASLLARACVCVCVMASVCRADPLSPLSWGIVTEGNSARQNNRPSNSLHNLPRIEWWGEE